MSKDAKRAIYILIFSNFLICLGISLIIPVEPFIKTEYHLTTTQMGIMTALFSFAQFIFSPIIGRISDKIGRSPVIIGGLIIFAISEFIFAIASTVMVFNFSRIIGGISAAMVVPTSMAMAADLTTEKDRAKVIGWLSAAFSGGLIVGPGIGGLLATIDYKTPFWASACLGIISAFVFFVLVPKHIKDYEADLDNSLDTPQVSQAGVKHLLKNSAVVTLFLMILVAAFGLQGFESIYTIYVHQVFNFSLNNISVVLILNGVLSLILQVVFFDKLINSRGSIKLIRDCYFLSAIGIVWILLAHDKISVVIATLLIFCAFDVLRPAITTVLTKFGKNNQGTINGLNMSLTSIGNIFGPIIAGSLMDINHFYPYSLVAIILAIAGSITFLVSHEMRKQNLIK
ncbi:MFS transporter [Lactobacillus sp. S2-2]|uniref:MFS transporter n=1 Tax=Lactobacillus sp. S2-2 TaxID=2692917 RepID=UPI001F1EBFD3|nr:MFS transporter [Lactobacillus sp. S2-2]MCF6514582.1 MFS transporter [Lactobacillus sp. S2-2]